MLRSLVVLALLVGVDSIAIDNGVQGNPMLLCTDLRMELHVTLQKPLFQTARIYVKGMSSEAACFRPYPPSSQNHNTLAFQVSLGHCGMRPINNGPNRGRSYVTTFIVSFHRLFVTKVDRAYRLICNYGGTASSSITASFGVSMLPTTDLVAQSYGLPDCSYNIFRVNSRNQRVPIGRFAQIGDKIAHEWTCRNVPETHYLWVRDCIVSPEYPKEEQIIDDRGCTVDPVLMGELEYGRPPYHTVIGQHHAYKFSDYPTLVFQCSITICDPVAGSCKHTDGSVVTVPPVCQTSRLQKRQIRGPNPHNQAATVIDLISEPLEIMQLVDIDPNNTNEYLADDPNHSLFGPETKSCMRPGTVCLSQTIFSGLVMSIALLLIGVIVSIIVMLSTRGRPPKAK